MTQPGRPSGKERDYQIALAARHAARLGSFVALDLKPHDYLAIFQSQLPILRTLHLVHEDVAPDAHPMSAVCIDAPNLHFLRIAFHVHIAESGSPITSGGPGMSLNVPMLRDLDITMSYVQKSDKNLRWIVTLLRGTPLLWSLRISLRITLDSCVRWDSMFEGKPLPLPHLQRLELEGSFAANMGEFFKCIGAPSSRRIKIGRTGQQSFGNPVDALQFVDTYRHVLCRPSYNGLLVRLSDTRAGCILAVASFNSSPTQWTGVPQLPGDLEDIAMLSIASAAPSDAPIHRQIVDRLASALRNNDIQYLVVEAPSFKAWPAALETLLRLCTKTAHVSIQHLWNHHNPGFPIFPTPGILPSLHTLSIKPVPTYRSGLQYHQSIQAWWKELSVWLERRASSGSRVRELHIHGQHEHRGHAMPGLQKHQHEDVELRTHAAEFVDELFDERV